MDELFLVDSARHCSSYFWLPVVVFGFKTTPLQRSRLQVFPLNHFLLSFRQLVITLLCLLFNLALSLCLLCPSLQPLRVTHDFTCAPPSCFSLPLKFYFYNISRHSNQSVPTNIIQMGPSNSVTGNAVVLRKVSTRRRGQIPLCETARSWWRRLNAPALVLPSVLLFNRGDEADMLQNDTPGQICSVCQAWPILLTHKNCSC